jgi:CDP-2,3-bis-(O-geranylgeranyl)-sn-glycerol synthase
LDSARLQIWKILLIEILRVSYMLLPLLVGLAVHGFCMKLNWLAFLARPIDGGGMFRGRQLFGSNKTYRGVIAVGVGTALGFGIQAIIHHQMASLRHLELIDYSRINWFPLGFAVGAAAMLSELPNSFFKRQLGIAPGAAGNGVMGVLFYILDQIDMLLGVWLVLLFAVEVTLARVLWSAVFLFWAHQIITLAGYALGMRATAR